MSAYAHVHVSNTEDNQFIEASNGTPWYPLVSLIQGMDCVLLSTLLTPSYPFSPEKSHCKVIPQESAFTDQLLTCLMM